MKAKHPVVRVTSYLSHAFVLFGKVVGYQVGRFLNVVKPASANQFGFDTRADISQTQAQAPMLVTDLTAQ
jgi:hypothetical protein